jgi:hypothetical protein
VTPHEGGCHCGAVRFRVEVEEYVALDCNCSVCEKKGFLHLIVPPERFRILRGEEELTTYTFNTRVAKHLFCRRCGVHPFYRPRSHPDGWDVNVRCFDPVCVAGPRPRDVVPVDALSLFRVERFDGRDWEGNVEAIRGYRS